MTLVGVILDRTGKITLCNDFLLSLTGWKREEVMNQSWFELFLPPEIRDTVRQEVFSGPMSGGELPVHLENEIVTRQGERRLVVWNNTFLRDQAGAIVGVASIGEDVTARKQGEAEVRQLNANLERRVRERTAELEQSTLSLQESEQRHRTILRTAMDGFWRVTPQGRLLEVNEGYCRMSGYGEQELLAMSIPDLEAAETAASTAAHLQEILRRGDDRFESRHRRKDGSIFAVEVCGQYRPSEGGHVVAFLRDITERKRAMDELQSRAIQQSALAELARCALAKEESPAFLDTVARVVASTLAVEFCGVLQSLPDQRALKLVAGVGWREGLAGHAVLALEPDSQADYTLARTQPVIVHDLRTEGRFRQAALLRDHGVESGLSMRIGGPEGTWGVLGAHTVRQRSFTPDEADFLQTAAHLLGTVIDRRTTEKALLDMSRHLQEAEDAERRRIAKELHDSTAQDLAAVILNLETLREAASVRDPAEASQIEDSIALLEHSAHEIRTLSYLLHPPRLQDSGLTGAIRHYLTGFGERTGIVTTVDLPTTCPELEQTVALALYRVVQESLGNVYRHAHSSCAAVRLAREGDDLVLEIRDEGRGIPAQFSTPELGLIPGFGVGLPAMQERLRQIGGHLKIESTPHGTTVRVRVPVKG
jgi:PAS domain S-box-containing protein